MRRDGGAPVREKVSGSERAAGKSRAVQASTDNSAASVCAGTSSPDWSFALETPWLPLRPSAVNGTAEVGPLQAALLERAFRWTGVLYFELENDFFEKVLLKNHIKSSELAYENSSLASRILFIRSLV